MNLVPLYEEAIQFNNFNGTVLAAGKVEVWYLGRTRKADIYADVAGETPIPNPLDLNDLGMQEVYVNPAFNYTLVVYDPYGAELFSVDKYLQGAGDHTTSNVVVQPSEHIGVSAWTVGEVQIYQPYLVGEVGKTYEGISPIVVNNVEDKISAQHVPLGVQDPLYFVQDDEEGCIIGFSGQTVPEGVMTESALGFENNKITGYNGSAFSAGNEYEAGDNIDITNGVISGKDWTDEIHSAANDASAAATAWTDSQGYLTGVDLSEYAKESFVISAIDSSTSGLLPTSAFATASGSFITALPSDLATTGWVDSQGYLTAVDIPESAVWNATTQTVSANSAAWAGGTANPQIPVTSTSGISIFESGDKVYFNISANYATEDWVTGQGYLTAETDWTNTITAASANAYNEATATIPTGLATTGDLQTVSGEITALIPSTAGLATEDWVTAQGYLTASYTPEFAYHDTAISSIDNSALYDTSAHARINTLAGRISDLSSNKADVTTLNDYQTTAGMTAYMTTGDSAEFMTTAERSDYIPTGVSSEFYTTANTAGYISEVPDTYLQNTDLSTEDGKVTAISGIPLSAGGDVPEGVMVESGLEYNAVNEISGYNGSAIAQYGAEKQWLVHDDTLVHASNSAQYALGVNLSAIAQLLGVDETVLYENSAGASVRNGITCSENPFNFNELKIYWYCESDTNRKIDFISPAYLGLNDKFNLSYSMPADNFENMNYMYLRNCTMTLSTSGISLRNAQQAVLYNKTVTLGPESSNFAAANIVKVVGIGRKQ